MQSGRQLTARQRIEARLITLHSAITGTDGPPMAGRDCPTSAEATVGAADAPGSIQRRGHVAGDADAGVEAAVAKDLPDGRLR